MPNYTNRTYVDGTNTSRNRRAEVTSGADDFTSYVVQLGDTNVGAAGSDTADAPLIGLVKRALQTLTSILGRFPTALDADRLKVVSDKQITNFQTASDVTVTSTTTTVITQVTAGYENVGLEIINTGGAALTACSILVAFSTANWYYAKLGSDADYTTNTALQNGNSTIINMEASASPRLLAAGARAWLRLNVRGVYGIRITATCATTTTISVRGHAC
jgi:hypothetical protein